MKFGSKYYVAMAAYASVSHAYELQTLQQQDQSTGEIRYSFTFDFENGDDVWLPDHDHIVIAKKCDQGVPSGHVRFGLVEPGTWWKSVTVFAGDKFDYELVAVQDAPGVTKYADVPIPNLSIYNYVLSKAKTFGTH